MVMKITIDDRAMRKFVRTMPAASKRSQARALNKAITMTRTQAARAISDKRNIKVGRAREDMRLYRASPAKPEAAIIARSIPIKLIEVKGAKRQTKRGVTAKITAKGKPTLFEHAFIAQMPSGQVGVFRRVGSKRLPITEIHLPSVAATLTQADIDTLLRAFAAPVYERELVRLLELEMMRAGAR